MTSAGLFVPARVFTRAGTNRLLTSDGLALDAGPRHCARWLGRHDCSESLITLKDAPCGSMRVAKRPTGTSIAGAATLAPSPVAASTVASQSVTAKYTPQCGGT